MNRLKVNTGLLESKRMLVIYGLVVLVFGYYVWRLFSYQILNGSIYLAQSEENRISEISVPTTRGIIMDRNGYVLARNIPSYSITITPAYLPSDEGAIQQVYRQLSEVIGVPVSKGEMSDETVRLFKPCETDLGITQIVYIADTNWPYDPVKVACDVDEEVARIVMENEANWQGVGVLVEPVREYPTGSYTSEIIGFLGPITAALEEYYRDQGFVPDRDKIGYAGVEYSLQSYLGGINGKRVVEVDAAGQELRNVETPIDPIPGYNVELTIDTRLQIAAQTALTTELNWWNTYLNRTMSDSGVVIAINPKTGEILALVSYPSYENNRMARLIPAYYYDQLMADPNRPLFDHAISAEVPPGSVFKMAAAMGAINEGVVTPQQELQDPGKITVNQQFSPNDPGVPREYVCWTDAGHGMVNYVHAIALSCDVYFYKISGGFHEEVPQGLGIWRLGEYARALGYDRLTGIELPGEEYGLMPDPTWKRLNVGENWATGDTYIASMGQGYVLSTPLQVLVSYAIIANDGKYMQPTLVREVLDSEGNVIKPFEPQLIWDITKDPLITVYDENGYDTGEKRTIEPWVIELTQEGLRMVVEEGGTADVAFAGMEIQAAGKTGTAEYCDDIAQSKNLCTPGNFPTHSWFVGYAPYDDPEIVVVAFVYNGGEGASVAAPIVRNVLDAYFELKTIDSSAGSP
jgi:penicillin-binding protein 2